jgi:hypothetical protein
MAGERSFKGVDEEAWETLRSRSTRDHGTIYQFEGDDETSGTATTRVPVIGDIVMHFHLDVDAATLTYTIVQKPMVVREDQIWDGIEKSVEDARA